MGGKTNHSNCAGSAQKWVVKALILGSALLIPVAGAEAGTIKDPPRFSKASDYSSVRHWNLKGENIVPHGVNPLYFPLIPGHKHIHENPDHPDGHYRKETQVLPETEPFDIPEIGKFETAVVQEEEYMDGVLFGRALLWFAIDKTTNNVFEFGELNWEIDEEGNPVFDGTWRAGEPDRAGIRVAGLLMPGTFLIGSRYLYDAADIEAHGGAENLEIGLEYTTPAGKFENCVRVREQDLLDKSDVTDKIWCPGVGIVFDTSDGALVASNVLPEGSPAADVSSFGKFLGNKLDYTPPVAKIGSLEATKIALNEIPGEATSVNIERKRGKNVYVVEVQSKTLGEKDVFVDIETGEVVGTD